MNEELIDELVDVLLGRLSQVGAMEQVDEN
jgi:hypothetical protein